MGLVATLLLKVVEVGTRIAVRPKPPVIDYKPLYDNMPRMTALIKPGLTAAPISVTPTPVTTKKVQNIQPQPIVPSASKPVSTQETIDYQKRELGKEFLLLEKHLQQQCKINGKACDCCSKHPLVIEALSQEGLGLSGEAVFSEAAAWSRKIAPLTTEEASRSGQFDAQYPLLAIEARAIRKRLMGTTDIDALLSPETREKVIRGVQAVVSQVMKGEANDSTEKV